MASQQPPTVQMNTAFINVTDCTSVVYEIAAYLCPQSCVLHATESILHHESVRKLSVET